MRHPAHPVYPYLLRDLAVVRPQAMDSTYVAQLGGHTYLSAVRDWQSRALLSWEISNTCDAAFCVRAL